MSRGVFLAISTVLLLTGSAIVSAHGHRVWENEFDSTGRSHLARGITASRDLAVAIGTGTTATGQPTLTRSTVLHGLKASAVQSRPRPRPTN